MVRDQLETGEMYIKRLQRDEEVSSCPYIKIIDLTCFIKAIYENGDMEEDPGLQDEILDAFLLGIKAKIA